MGTKIHKADPIAFIGPLGIFAFSLNDEVFLFKRELVSNPFENFFFGRADRPVELRNGSQNIVCHNWNYDTQ